MGTYVKKLKHLVQQYGKWFEIQEEEGLGYYLGIKISKKDDGSVALTQPQLIESIFQHLGQNKDNVKGCTTPSLTTVLIHRDADREPFDNAIYYCSVIGKVNFLNKSTRPEIACAVHQCARNSNTPKQSHADDWKQNLVSSTETEFKSFSTAERGGFPSLEVLQEAAVFNIVNPVHTPVIKMFEDN
jgi:hypothetical protein